MWLDYWSRRCGTNSCALGDCFESHDSLRAVDGDKLPIAEQRHGPAHRHHGRQPHLAGRNRAVGEWTAALRNEAGGAIEERRPGRVRRLGHQDGALNLWGTSIIGLAVQCPDGKYFGSIRVPCDAYDHVLEFLKRNHGGNYGKSWMRKIDISDVIQ